jgi:subtilisin family serine protease
VLELERGVTDVEAAKALDRHLDAVGEWAHGTHVAGILLFQNPRAKLVAFRSAWAGEARPYYERGPTDDELAKERANMEAIAAFITANHVRVVNASLGFSVDYLEDELRHETATYHDDDAVRARARAVQDRRKANWAWVIEHCPETLFVVAAGNSNRDVIEYDDIPASLAEPNLLVVGAVNRFGEWATFTNSSPERVRVFGYGVEVDSVIPNGTHVPLSGTSMASPFVANTAAKMIAVNPHLAPADVIRLLAQTGDAIPAPFDGVIANQRAAIDAARHAPATPGATAAPATPATPASPHAAAAATR